MKVCALVPMFNEALHIGGVVQGCRSHVPVVAIDDGSVDHSARLAAQAGAHVISQDVNAGKGAALQRGFDYALAKGYDAVIQLDGDGQHDPAEIPRFISTVESDPSLHIVVGSRMHKRQGMPFARALTNRVMSAIISHLCGQRLLDTQCGYRLVRSDVLRSVALTASRYDIETELLLQACAAGFRVAEIPIRSIYTDQTSDIRVIRETWRFLKMLWRYRSRHARQRD